MAPAGSARSKAAAAVGRRLRLSGARPGAAAGRARRADAAGMGLARLTVMPAILVMAWLLPGLPLLLAGEFLPVPELLIFAPLVIVLAANGLSRVPARWPRVLPGPARHRGWMAWWGMIGTVAVAAGFAVWQFAENSPSLIVSRDPGAYLQTGYWLAQHGSLPIPQSLAAFGGAHAGLAFSSTGFFQHATSVVPAFMSGLPMLLAGGFWTHGISVATAMGPILGAFAVLAFGGLVARLAGVQWAPAGALVLGLTLPEQYTSRASFSETVVQVLLFGGLCLVIDSQTLAGPRQQASPRGLAGPDPLPKQPGQRRIRNLRRLVNTRAWAAWLTQQRIMAALGGLALGLTALVSADALVFLLGVIPFAGVLAAGRRAIAVPFCLGAVVGAGYGVADGYLLSRPFMASVGSTMELIGLAAVWLTALTIVGFQALRVPRVRAWARRTAARRPVRWIPVATSLLVLAALIGLVVRPYLQTVRGSASKAVLDYVALLQRAEHLPIDPARKYAEDTLYWVVWYAGAPAVLLGGFGLALLVRRSQRGLLTWQDPAGAWRNWALPLAIICTGSVAVLWQPDIVPDQPWASRRLVPVVIPGLIVCAAWASAWLTGRARERGAGAPTATIVGLFCVAALLVPTATTTFGLGLTHSGRAGGLRPTADGMAFRRTGGGEMDAVSRLCASIGRSSSVVIVDWRIAQQFTQVIRGLCGVPVGWMVGQPTSAVGRVLAGIATAGRHPLLLAARPAQLTAFGGSPVRVLDLTTTQDPQELTQPPTTPRRVHYVIWMSASSSPGVGT